VVNTVSGFNAALDGINGGQPVLSYIDPISGKDIPIKVSYIFWLLFVVAFSYAGAVLPIWRWAQPVNYIGFWVMALTPGGC
jgi:hypothetical protein